MEFLSKNEIQTTTALTVESQTTLVQFLLKRDDKFQWISSGFNSDATTTTLTITFGATTSISRLGLLATNWKDFTVYHSGVTANTLNLTATGATTTSDWSSNSETSMMLAFATISVTEIAIDVSGTIVADSEKAVGYIYAGDLLLSMERLPSYDNYSPLYKSKETVHRLSDGSTRMSSVDQKFQTKLSWDYISKTFRDNLFEVWDDKEDFFFAAFPTATSWDRVLYPVVWTGDFNFFQYSDNASDSGFSGSITLMETIP